MKAIRTEVKIYWDDNMTIECRDFPSIRQANKYVIECLSESEMIR